MERTDFHVGCSYRKPSTVLQIHPDLAYKPNENCIQPFIKPGPSIRRKRDSAAISGPEDLSFWDSNDLAACREKFGSWRRRDLPLSSEEEKGREPSLQVFVVEVGDALLSVEQKPSFWQQDVKNQISSVLTIYGICLNDGSSISMRVWGFSPYVLAECPQALQKYPAEQLTESVKQQVERNLPAQKDLIQKVHSVEMLRGESLMEYDPSKSNSFFRINLTSPRLVGACRTLIEGGIKILDGTTLDTTPYEASVPHSLRWMIDKDIVGCGCISVPRSDLSDVPARFRSTRCSKEVDVAHKSISVFTCENETESIPDTIRILSLDIECVTVAARGFPTPQNDPVIQISSILTSPGRSLPIAKTIFTLDTCAPIAGATVFSFKDEKAMLSTWREMVLFMDPDILTGYNFINFDLNYLIVRSNVLDVPNFRNLGRVIDIEAKIRDSVLSTRALGTHENKDINIEGRIQLDALDCIRRDYKLKSYSLNAVASHFLKEQKEDVHYSEIGNLQRGNPETRKRIAVYCIKDSWLVLRLLEALSLLVNYIEMARVTGVPINMLLSRGQQIKVTSQLLRKCKEMRVFMPSLRMTGPGGGEVGYEGATVLEPMKDFYEIPIATLDFASLYPSIMIAHNLCYSTLIPDNKMKAYPEADRFQTPANKMFVKAHIKQGILPSIVSDLMAARKKAKNQLKVATDPLTRMVLDARQLALKVSANSVYGYTGAANNGQLPCLAISESITAYGRQMIDFSKSQVEERYMKVNGYEHDAIVVYGDTDSIMVKFGSSDIETVMNLGRDAATFVSSKFLPPISLEFEKVFLPFLLMNKKRYAGLMWTNPHQYAKIDCKGIETVRRDFCLLVQKMCDDALKALLIDRDVKKARNLTKQRIQDLLLNKIDMSYLVLSKSLGKEDYATKLAHVELAKKLKLRDPATAPQIGDRVYYVIVAGAKGQAQFERAEDPLYALENNIPIDVDFYLDSIKNPISRIFEPIEKGKVDDLFTGEHTRHRKLTTSATGALSGFVTTGLRCLSCRGVVKSGAFCQHCMKSEEKTQQVILEKLVDFSEKENEFSRLWVECQRCQESLHQDVICTSRDCPIFYKRMKVKKEVVEMNKTIISRLGLEDW